MLFQTINTKYFFIDYITLNITLEPKIKNNLSEYRKSKYDDFVKESEAYLKLYYQKAFIPKWIGDLKTGKFENKNLDFYKGVQILTDRFRNIQINFKGKFFEPTKTIKKDYQHFYDQYEMIDQIIQEFYKNKGVQCNCGKLLPHQKHTCPDIKFTISRMDISNNIPTYFDNNWKDFFKPSDKVIKYEMKQNGIPLITGIEAKKINTKSQPNMMFKAYDKRIPNPNQPNSRKNCVKRFGTVDIIRREWVLKSQWLKTQMCNTPNQAFQTIMREHTLKSVIRKMRKTRDIVFYKLPKEHQKLTRIFDNVRKDTDHYMSLHSEEARYYKRHFHSDLSITELKKLLRKKPKAFLKNHRAKEYVTIKYNPYTQMKGLSKHLHNMTWKESYDLLDLQIKHLYNNKYVKPTTSYDSDAEYQDYLIKLTGSYEDLKNFIVKGYDKSLKDINNDFKTMELKGLEEIKEEKFDKSKHLTKRWIRDGYGIDKHPPKKIAVNAQNDTSNEINHQLSIEDIKKKYLIIPTLRRGKKGE